MLQNQDSLRIQQVTPYLLDDPTPNSLSVAGLQDAQFGATYGKAAANDEYVIVIEALLQKNPDIQWQKVLRKLLAPTGATSLRAAVEANKLTSRLADDGTVTTDQEPACDDLHVEAFRGQTTYTTPGGIVCALGEWTVRVLT